MPEFSTSIKIDGLYTALLTIPRGGIAWQRATAVYCPLGPAPTRAWVLLRRWNLDKLSGSTAHTITWTAHAREASQIVALTFRGLYLVTAQRIMQGNLDAADSAYLVEFADGRAIAANASDSNLLNVNVRSYAQSTDYLTGTEGGTWTNLCSNLWAKCPTLGAFPGLPAGITTIPPENIRFPGINAYAALCRVLDQLDLAICPNPFAGTFSIVQLGAAQTVETTAKLKWDADVRAYNATKAATHLAVYSPTHYEAFGQERDTELSDNWSTTDVALRATVATGVAGAAGVKPIWDDLPQVRGENGTISNTSDLATRLTTRATRYAARMNVPEAHKIYAGLTSTIVPGGKVRAVIWRNYDDGKTNTLGGTVTEYIAGPAIAADLTGNAKFGDTLPVQEETFGPPDIARKSYPNYPRLPNIVQVNHSGASAGDTVAANADGFHKGRVRRWVAGEMAILEDCWIRFVDDHDNLDGQVDSVQGELYGPARLCGIATSGGETLPVYLVRQSAGSYVDIVQVVDEGSPGDVIIRDMSIRPVYQGKIRRYDHPGGDGTLEDKGYCWLLFVDDYDNVLWDTAVVNYEYYGPAKYVGRQTYDFTELPTYTVRRGELVEMVQVYHDDDTPPSPGDVVEGNASGYHDGVVVRYSGTSTLDPYAKCWIQFTTPFNGLAIQSQYYGPAKYAGTYDLVTDPGEETETHDKRPVFIVDHGDHVFPGRFDAAIADGSTGTFSVYHPTTLTDSTFNLTVKCHGDPIIEGKGFATFVGTTWFGANSECETSAPPE